MPYKLPICYLTSTYKMHGFDANGKPLEDLVITAEMVELSCTCTNEFQAFFCKTGHLTECHVGKTCKEAECDHYRRQQEIDREENY